MILIRPSEERGHVRVDGVDSYHTFSFDQYYDPNHMGYGPLRVINEDIVAPGSGFGAHEHKDMEILTYVLEGALEHRDNMGSGALIQPGDVLHMTAGTGILHSESNPSEKLPVHLLQIWIEPDQKGLKPSYEQHTYHHKHLEAGFSEVAGRNAPIHIHQDVSMYASRLEKGDEGEFYLKDRRDGWLQVAKGRVRLNGVELRAGDGAAVAGEHELTCLAIEDSEVLLFDLPGQPIARR